MLVLAYEDGDEAVLGVRVSVVLVRHNMTSLGWKTALTGNVSLVAQLLSRYFRAGTWCNGRKTLW